MNKYSFQIFTFSKWYFMLFTLFISKRLFQDSSSNFPRESRNFCYLEILITILDGKIDIFKNGRKSNMDIACNIFIYAPILLYLLFSDVSFYIYKGSAVSPQMINIICFELIGNFNKNIYTSELIF